MAKENLPPEEAAKRSVGRMFQRFLAWVVVLTVLGAWGWFGGATYILEPGEAAVVLRLGRHVETVTDAGFHWTPLPAPFMRVVRVNTSKIQREGFGIRVKETADTEPAQVMEASMQTGDNNIVRVGFSVQFNVKDAYAQRFRITDSSIVVRDAAQAAMREVVGRMSVDQVLRGGKDELVIEAERVLQALLDAYESGLQVTSIEAQNIQAPMEVADAFEDVLRATQNADQAINEAEGYRNEVLPAARAEAQELLSGAAAHYESTIANAVGQAERFRAITAEYRKAPQVTEQRLFIEAMEEILPSVEKILVDGKATQVLPYLPLEKGVR